MKILVVGLGSMGQRRIRNLKALGVEEIAGYDMRDDRVKESVSKYGITPYSDFEAALLEFDPEGIVISTSPKCHMDYAEKAHAKGIGCFIEASVTEADRILCLAKAAERSGVVMAPSCTMRYYPGPKKVTNLLRDGVIGKIMYVNYQTGQWLPDWHPWEDISEFYVSDRETGGCREIVPFELAWLNDMFGEPVPKTCVKGKVSEMNADIDDIYQYILQYPGGINANITVEVLSQPAVTREMRIVGSEGVLVYSADENCVRYIRGEDEDWTRFPLDKGTVEKGYINPEEPYIEEIQSYLDALVAKDQSLYPNTLADDYQLLRTLYQLEDISLELD